MLHPHKPKRYVKITDSQLKWQNHKLRDFNEESLSDEEETLHWR